MGKETVVTEQPPLNPREVRVALMVEILHTYQARNLARARNDTATARQAQHHLAVLLDQLATARTTNPVGAHRVDRPR
ncbi:hypothetical protein A8924_5367 [Saccharopolyspora erythraea NRRL 2338]|nr:hypothetical protein A8924_5367 [Saccharopolyspora erythraea NRRL 2338]